MKKDSAQPKAHFFICTRRRENKKASCANSNSEDLVFELKKWAKDSGLKKSVKISQSSCLGYCKRGIAACLYPQNEWFTDINLKDADKIKKMLRECAK